MNNSEERGFSFSSDEMVELSRNPKMQKIFKEIENASTNVTLLLNDIKANWTSIDQTKLILLEDQFEWYMKQLDDLGSSPAPDVREELYKKVVSAEREAISNALNNIDKPSQALIDIVPIEFFRIHLERTVVADKLASYGWHADMLMSYFAATAFDFLLKQDLSIDQNILKEHMYNLWEVYGNDIQTNAVKSLEHILEKEDAEEQTLFLREACKAILKDGYVGMIAPAAYARAEGIFKRVMVKQGWLPSSTKQALYGNTEAGNKIRKQALLSLKAAQLSYNPSFDRSGVFTFRLFERLEEARDVIIGQGGLESLGIISRNGIMHGDLGGHTQSEALRSLCFYTNLTIFLGWRLEPTYGHHLIDRSRLIQVVRLI
ncbi:hypothetical protein [Deinococcus ruber]|uniref:Uncharacterized protein n=1 Tax=Deinococcus ruber TaxID=1848197 RepID=A0A918F977_9DEIO|nr:hypothetical protein [Deinococcus ruber]GGR17579.1 hypothetical protein GCM10008957_32940 [Deinococcus ruber]